MAKELDNIFDDSGDKISIEMKDNPFDSGTKKELNLQITGNIPEESKKEESASEPVTDDKKESEEISEKDIKDTPSEEITIDNEEELLETINEELREAVDKEEYSDEKPIPKEKFKKRLEKQKQGFLYQLTEKNDRVAELERQIVELKNQNIKQEVNQTNDDELSLRVDAAINTKQVQLGRDLSTSEILSIYDRIKKEDYQKEYQEVEKKRTEEYIKVKEQETIKNFRC